MLRAKIGLVTIIIVGLLALGTGGRAQTPAERIHLFHSAIEILSDGSVLVSESLTIEALGQEIKRGILRDIPIIYRDRFNNRVSVHLEVISVTRDGREENYVLENVGDNLRIRIGRRDHFLSHGIHRYAITYRMTRMVGFFTDYDEIYWNVTGNDWSLPIDRVEARVRLPQGAALIQQDAYSGRRGTQGKDFTFGAEGADLVFRSTRPFSPGEGLTVAVAFPKGFVEEPSELEVALTYVQFNQAFGVSLIGLAGLTLYFLVVWWFIGRDPRGGAIFARYHPPRDLSPAAMRFIIRMGFDNKVFSSALVSLAVKGRIKLEEEDSDFTILSDDEAAEGLSIGEKRLAGRLLGRKRELALENKNHKKIKAARKALKNFLKAEYQTANFTTNWGWFTFGLVIILITVIGLAFSAQDIAAVGFMSLWLSIWSLGCYALLGKVFTAFMEAIGGSFAGIIRTLGLAVFTFPFIAGEVIGISILAAQIGYAATIGLAFQGVLALAFYQWLQAPTHAGRKLMDEIEGFRLYLEVAEQPRLEALHPPKETLGLFERYLPYALALDVENAWCARFENQIAAAVSSPGEGNYHPRWYHGRSWGSGDSRRSLTDLGKTLGQSLGVAAGAAATAPGSSSGSGGGGSSGGGGGGGGGSGW